MKSENTNKMTYRYYNNSFNKWEVVDHDQKIVGEYFTAKELACRGSGLIRLDTRFTEALQSLREAYGKPMKVNSCCREILYNTAIGGNKRSLHLYYNIHHPVNGTMAIDIGVGGKTMLEISELLELSRSMGWSIGHGYKVKDGKAEANSFIHLDRRIDIPMPQKEFYY